VGSSSGVRAGPAPEKKDFWDSFGEAGSAAGEKKGSAIGTAAMKKGGKDGWDDW